jgi:hypothetical protein
MKELWRTLQLGGLEVRVYLVPEDELPDAYGTHNKFEIRLRNNMPKDLFWQTLVHECSHAVFEAYGLGEFLANTNDEEKVVALLAAGVHQMLKPFIGSPQD